MATIGNDTGGRKRILFMASDGTRKTVRLGKASAKQAAAFKIRVESIVTARITGSMDDETARWLAALPAEMHARLEAVGLVQPREAAKAAITLGGWIDSYIRDRTDAKPNTIRNLNAARKELIAHFGADQPLAAITVADADQFWRYLLRRGLGTNTARRICGRAKQFLAVAIDAELPGIARNPFRKLQCRVQANRGRQQFIPRADIDRVYEACPDLRWRLIFALARYGGMRCPSELQALRWEHVNFERNTILIHAAKTEHHEHGGQRLMPLFAELRPLLLEAFTAAPAGTERVLTDVDDACNLRTQARRIIVRAGLLPWGKTFQNLRSTRATELVNEGYPSHVVASWLGHTEAIADEFYRQVTQDQFDRAAGHGSGSIPPTKPASQDADHANQGANLRPLA